MASFMQNWWRKHDMDKDGKGCCLIALGIIGGVFLAGVATAGLLLWAIFS